MTAESRRLPALGLAALAPMDGVIGGRAPEERQSRGHTGSGTRTPPPPRSIGRVAAPTVTPDGRAHWGPGVVCDDVGVGAPPEDLHLRLRPGEGVGLGPSPPCGTAGRIRGHGGEGRLPEGGGGRSSGWPRPTHGARWAAIPGPPSPLSQGGLAAHGRPLQGAPLFGVSGVAARGQAPAPVPHTRVGVTGGS